MFCFNHNPPLLPSISVCRLSFWQHDLNQYCGGRGGGWLFLFLYHANSANIFCYDCRSGNVMRNWFLLLIMDISIMWFKCNSVSIQWWPRNWGASRGQTAFLRGTPPKKNSQKWLIFHIFSFWRGVGGRASDWGNNVPTPPPPPSPPVPPLFPLHGIFHNLYMPFFLSQFSIQVTIYHHIHPPQYMQWRKICQISWSLIRSSNTMPTHHWLQNPMIHTILLMKGALQTTSFMKRVL